MDVQLENNAIKKRKHIKIFPDSCDACLSHIDNVEVGKCVGCLLEVLPFDKSPVNLADETVKFRIKVHPTTLYMMKSRWKVSHNFTGCVGMNFMTNLNWNIY